MITILSYWIVCIVSVQSKVWTVTSESCTKQFNLIAIECSILNFNFFLGILMNKPTRKWSDIGKSSANDFILYSYEDQMWSINEPSLKFWVLEFSLEALIFGRVGTVIKELKLASFVLVINLIPDELGLFRRFIFIPPHIVTRSLESLFSISSSNLPVKLRDTYWRRTVCRAKSMSLILYC